MRALTGPGAFVAIGGPSGVGKDTLLDYARTRLAGDTRFLFVRRTITRPADAGGEAHRAIDADGFARLEAAGAFAVSWGAHGLRYGLPIEIDAAIGQGQIVIANISRTVLPQLRARYARVLAVLVTADPATLRLRLAARGREDADEIARRVARSIAEEADAGWIELRNSGSVTEAGDALCALIEGAAH